MYAGGPGRSEVVGARERAPVAIYRDARHNQEALLLAACLQCGRCVSGMTPFTRQRAYRYSVCDCA
jgi:heterodisulfide reductase subunit C